MNASCLVRHIWITFRLTLATSVPSNTVSGGILVPLVAHMICRVSNVGACLAPAVQAPF
jgi:hypothetical protein